jgi:hypothetical protein
MHGLVMDNSCPMFHIVKGCGRLALVNSRFLLPFVTFDSRSFPGAGRHNLNLLWTDATSAQSIPAFQYTLKLFLFSPYRPQINFG